MPAVVSSLDPETGALKIDLKPNAEISLQDQQRLLRPRTKPELHHLEWARKLLREGRINTEAERLFERYASPEVGAGNVEKVLVMRPEALAGVGREVDALLGVTGTACRFKAQIQQLEGNIYTLDNFTNMFWELLWETHREHGQALSLRDCSRCRSEDPRKIYDFTKALGSGTFGEVMLAVNKETKVKRAIKKMIKENMMASMEQLDSEVAHLRSLDHPNIVKLYEAYEDKNYVYLVMDFCSGGDLQSAVHKRLREGVGPFMENFVRDVLKQILMAIAHVHSHGIVHMDLKSANIMLTPNKSTLPPSRMAGADPTLVPAMQRPHVMVIDLGVAQIFRPGNFKNNQPMGTPATMAPEIWRGEITPKADVFSIGVVFFELITLRLPFNCSVSFSEALAYWRSNPQPAWQRAANSSELAVGLCRRMLLLDRHRRPVAAQCLKSPFITGHQQESPLVEDRLNPKGQVILKRLVKVPERSVLHKSVALSIAKAWPSNQLPTIKRIFQDLDTTGSGRLDKEQIAKALEQLGIDLESARMAANEMDLSRDGKVDWTEFVASCIHLGHEAMEDDLHRVFREADTDGDGYLAKADIANILAGDHLRGDVVNDIFSDIAGSQDDTHIDWQKFRKHFRSRSQAVALDELEPVAPKVEDKGVLKFDLPVNRPSAQAPVPATEVEEGFLSQAVGWFERARVALIDGPGSDVMEENVRRLGEMGFSDRAQCLAVLRKHRNRLSASTVDDLCSNP